MLQLKNSTKFKANMAVFPNEDAIDTLFVIVKATFNIGKEITLADEQAPVTEADIYWTEPGKSSIKYASEFHIDKPSTDIIMLGHACALDMKEVNELDVGLSVGNIHKHVKIFGDRQWKNGGITYPQRFTTMPMVYEKAYGGVHLVDDKIELAIASNPVGKGYVGKRQREEIDGLQLPNIEDPDTRISTIEDQPVPACFSYVAPNWQPRSGYAGTYDEPWRKNRAPYLPKDFNKRFYNTAHPDLVCPEFLQGGEPIKIFGMHPRGVIESEIPQVRLAALINIAGKEVQPKLKLETLILEPNQLKASIVWRAALPCDKQSLKISEIKVALA